MRSLLCLLSILLLSLPALSQIYKESDLLTQAADSTENFVESRTGGAMIFLNTSSGDLSVKINLSSIKTGNPLIDSTLSSLSDAQLSFRGNTDMDIFKMFETQNDGRSYTINGLVTILGKDTRLNAIFDPINFSGPFDANSLKMEFKLLLDLSKIYVPGFSELRFKAVSFEVSPGLVNITNQ